MHFDDRHCEKKPRNDTVILHQLSTKSTTISRAEAEVTEASFSAQAIAQSYSHKACRPPPAGRPLRPTGRHGAAGRQGGLALCQ